MIYPDLFCVWSQHHILPLQLDTMWLIALNIFAEPFFECMLWGCKLFSLDSINVCKSVRNSNQLGDSWDLLELCNIKSALIFVSSKLLLCRAPQMIYKVCNAFLFNDNELHITQKCNETSGRLEQWDKYIQIPKTAVLLRPYCCDVKYIWFPYDWTISILGNEQCRPGVVQGNYKRISPHISWKQSLFFRMLEFKLYV